MELKTLKIENPGELNFILGHAHFIKTVEDIHEAIVCTVPNAKFGVAFCEASDVCLVRYSGTAPEYRAWCDRVAAEGYTELQLR